MSPAGQQLSAKLGVNKFCAKEENFARGALSLTARSEVVSRNTLCDWVTVDVSTFHIHGQPVQEDCLTLNMKKALSTLTTQRDFKKGIKSPSPTRSVTCGHCQ
jgi:hypothetical protein